MTQTRKSEQKEVSFDQYKEVKNEIIEISELRFENLLSKKFTKLDNKINNVESRLHNEIAGVKTDIAIVKTEITGIAKMISNQKWFIMGFIAFFGITVSVITAITK